MASLVMRAQGEGEREKSGQVGEVGVGLGRGGGARGRVVSVTTGAPIATAAFAMGGCMALLMTSLAPQGPGGGTPGAPQSPSLVLPLPTSRTLPPGPLPLAPV